MESGEEMGQAVDSTELVIISADEGLDWWVFVCFEQVVDVGFDVVDRSDESKRLRPRDQILTIGKLTGEEMRAVG